MTNEIKEEETVYGKLVTEDFLSPLTELIHKDLVDLLPSGRIRLRTRFSPMRPWINAAHSVDRRCTEWHRYYFSMYNIIPRGCRSCWKVCFRPETVVDLFKVHEMQMEDGLVSKCGMETRKTSGNEGGYSAFWYTKLARGLEGGRTLWSFVKGRLNGLGMGNPILKRGCTEMEHKFPRSDLWDQMAPVWDEVEDLLDERFVPYNANIPVPEDIKIAVKAKWIVYAAEHGDLTYLELTGGNEIIPSLVTYERSEHLDGDFKGCYDGIDSARYECRDGETALLDWPKPAEGQLTKDGDGARSPLTLLH